MTNDYSSIKDFKTEFAGRIASEGLDAGLAEQLADRLAPLCVKNDGISPGLGLRLGSWVVRSEDLSFFSVLKGGILAYVAAAAGAALAAPVAGAVLAAAELGFKVWRKGGRLTPEQMRVLVELEQCQDGLTPGDLAVRISDETKTWTEEEALGVLNTLKKFIRKDRNTIAVADVGPDGRWRSVHGL